MPTIDRKCDFSQVTHRFASNPCTPTIKRSEQFIGIFINVPEEISFTEGRGATLAESGAKLQLCGASRFKYDELGLHGDASDAILFVAVDAATHRTFSGKIPPLPNAIPFPRDPSQPPERHPGLVVGDSFNPDLAEILSLPATDAEYIVYATLGPHKSNVLRTRVKAVRKGP